MASEGSGTMSGLTPAEAQEFHKAFMSGFAFFTGVAVIAHILVYMAKPWSLGM